MLTAETSIRGACRVITAEPQTGKSITSIGEIIELEEGEGQYDCQPWCADFGATKTGFRYSDGVVKFHVAELRPRDINNLLRSAEYMTLMLLSQRLDKSIQCHLFERVQVQYVDENMDHLWGESMTIPVEFIVVGGVRIMTTRFET